MVSYHGVASTSYNWAILTLNLQVEEGMRSVAWDLKVWGVVTHAAQLGRSYRVACTHDCRPPSPPH